MLLISGGKQPPMNDALCKRLKEKECQQKEVKEAAAKAAAGTAAASKPTFAGGGHL